VNPAILQYNEKREPGDKDICDVLAGEIDRGLSGAEGRIWHGHPVWFLDGNPIVGYSRQKRGIRLMFWSGADFGEAGLNVPGKHGGSESRSWCAADQRRRGHPDPDQSRGKSPPEEVERAVSGLNEIVGT